MERGKEGPKSLPPVLLQPKLFLDYLTSTVQLTCMFNIFLFVVAPRSIGSSRTHVVQAHISIFIEIFLLKDICTVALIISW